jgi:hypothetical protein
MTHINVDIFTASLARILFTGFLGFSGRKCRLVG